VSVAIVEVSSLGLVPYGEALALQQHLVERRRRDEIPDQLLLLQHPPVITTGVRTADARDHIVAGVEELQRRGVEVHEAGRGGDVTFHGPGQLVGYPILALPPERRDLHRYVRDLEEALILSLRRWGIEGGRISGLTGVWVGQEKVAAIGVRVSRWITSHGFALNVTTDLSHFGLIVPCGITDKGVTSMQRLLGRPVGVAEVALAFVQDFGEVFGLEPVPAAAGVAWAPR
jgi:lipoyl(octanoyl) transferase